MARHDRSNPNSRNFGLKNRDITQAGKNALKEGMQSHSSISTMTSRWAVFTDFLKSELNIRDMRLIETAHLQQYADQLIKKIERSELAPPTAQNYMSAVNRTLEIARGDRAVRLDPVREAGLPRRSGICVISLAVSLDAHKAAQKATSERLSAMLGLQREFGLRFEESAKINAIYALAQAQSSGAIDVKSGTKGGRTRQIELSRPEAQIAALKAAAVVQNKHYSLVPAEQNYAKFRSDSYRESERLGIKFHGERHAYSQGRYERLVGAKCAVAAGVSHSEHNKYLSKALNISRAEAKELDKAAREKIAQELGHGRTVITNSYLG